MTTTFRAESVRPLVLADRLRSCTQVLAMAGERGAIPVPFDRRVFGGCTPVILDAVSDWWDACGSDRWPGDGLTVNYRLPWPMVWAEWIDQNERRKVEARGIQVTGDCRKGILLAEYQLAEGQTPITFLHTLAKLGRGPHGAPPHSDRPEWHTYRRLVDCHPFLLLPTHPIPFAWPPIIFPVPEDGVIEDRPVGGTVPFAYFPPAHGVTVNERFVDQTWNDYYAMWRLFTGLLSVRNLGITDVHLPRGERRRMERQAIRDQGPPPFVRYKTLALTLPRPASENSGNRRDGGPASPIPFHLVRGHLADYRNGRGMFGKWKGVVWIPMHSRGFQRAGAIAKCYAANIAVDADPTVTVGE